MAALERARQDKEANGEIETEHPVYLGAQDTFYVGTLKGVGRIYQQTFIDTYCKIGFAKLYDRKSALAAADLLNDRVLPFCEEHGVPLLRILTDRGTEYIAASMNTMNMNYTLQSRTLTIAGPRLKARRPTASVGVSTRQYWMSFTVLPFVRKSTVHLTNCSPIWILG